MIITSYIEGEKSKILNLIQETTCDFVICADGGLKFAREAKISVDLTVGDFDSLGKAPTDTNIVQVPVEKDDTDLKLALDIATDKNPNKIFIIGGIGGRLDHTIGNIQSLVHYTKRGFDIVMLDPNQSICVQLPGTKTYTGNPQTKLSAFAFSDVVTNLSINGGYYPLSNRDINNEFPLCISNEFLENEITISFDSGILLVVRTTL